MCPADQCVDTINIDLAFFTTHTLDAITHTLLFHQTADGLETLLMRLQLEGLGQCLESAAFDETKKIFQIGNFKNLTTTVSCRWRLKLKRLPISDFLVELAKSKIDPLILLSQERVENA